MAQVTRNARSKGCVGAVGALLIASGPGLGATSRSARIGGYDERGVGALRPDLRQSWRARLVVPTRSHLGAGFGTPPGPMVQADGPYAGGAQVFLVLEARRAPDGSRWFRVLLPSRPNGRAAWLPETSLRVERNPWRIRVLVGARRVDLIRAGHVLASWKAAVGKSAYPTPTGSFAISEIVPQLNVGGVFGPVVLTLTAHSNTLSDFDGGDGRVALHGTNQPALLGSAASHGCVRLPNDAVRRIAKVVPPGTPVTVT